MDARALTTNLWIVLLGTVLLELWVLRRLRFAWVINNSGRGTEHQPWLINGLFSVSTLGGQGVHAEGNLDILVASASRNMAKRYPRDRADPRRGAKKKPFSASLLDVRFTSHPLYGEIPLVRETVTGIDGKTYTWLREDPDYRPPLPRGAVRGDVRKQNFCVAHHVPKYFYLDEERQCAQCGAAFTFAAAEQKYWYEALGFHCDSTPIRCVACRRRRRSEHVLREQIGQAKAALRAKPGDPSAHLSLARALVEYHERTDGGDLDEAVAAARKAAADLPTSSEPLFWEGVAQLRAGRPARGRALLETFLSRQDQAPARLAARAKVYLG